MASMVARRPNEGDLGGPSKRRRIHLKEWNSGLFALELSRHSIFPSTVSKHATGKTAAPLTEGTFHGTQMALTKIYSDIEDQLVLEYFPIGSKLTVNIVTPHTFRSLVSRVAFLGACHLMRNKHSSPFHLLRTSILLTSTLFRRMTKSLRPISLILPGLKILVNSSFL